MKRAMSLEGTFSGMSDQQYFEQISGALNEAGIATPRLVIDAARLDANIDTLLECLPDGMGYRVVVKSLPSPELISRVMKRSQTNRLMTFNLPMLKSFSELYPMADQLLGKPLPAKAMDYFFSKVRPRNAKAHRNIQWLVDTPERLEQYLHIAERYGTELRINLELDVGMHRGGFLPGAELEKTLTTLKSSNRATLSGFMGYEPHVPLMPERDGIRAVAKAQAFDTYRAVLSQAGKHFDQASLKGMTRNAAGSPTFRLWTDTAIANEVSVGSVLVKPTNFDTDLLTPFLESSFIATPVLKTWKGMQLPGRNYAPGKSQPKDLSTTVFTYGGYWMADPVYPEGLEHNDKFGRSSNQDMMIGPENLKISVDDFVFLRPRQSEAVFLQMGPLIVYKDGQIVDEWPVLQASP